MNRCGSFDWCLKFGERSGSPHVDHGHDAHARPAAFIWNQFGQEGPTSEARLPSHQVIHTECSRRFAEMPAADQPGLLMRTLIKRISLVWPVPSQPLPS